MKGVIARDVSEGKGKFPKEFNSYKIVEPDDLVFCLFDVDETPRTIGLSSQKGMITGAYDIFKVKGASKEFLYYFFLSLDNAKSLKPLYKGLRKVVPMPAFRAMPLFLPPLSEQLSIVSYLDGKVSGMDRLVLLTQQKVEHLKALKQAIIQEAVTTGMPNKNHILKQTNIRWIKQIPQHWEKCRCKDLLTEKKNLVGENAKDYKLLSLTIRGVIIRDTSEGKGKFPKEFNSYKIVEPNDFVFCLFDVEETPRTVGIAYDKGMITGAYDVFEVRNVNRSFLYYYFLSLDNAKALKPLYKGLRKVIPMPAFRSMPLFLPPLSEQEEIVAYLDEKTAKIDLLIDKELQQIDHIKDLKQTLIADVVTGKVDVTTKR